MRVAYMFWVISGEGGIGKSSSMAHLALNWASDNDDILKQFKLLFYIKLSEVTGKHKQLEEIIVEQHEELNGMEALLKTQLQDSNGPVLLILDGLDEYAIGSNTVIDNIVHNRSPVAMGKMCLIITSRSEANDLHSIRKQMKKVIVVKGFDERNVLRCAKNFFKSDGNEEEVSVFVKNDISGLLRVPIFLVMAYLLHQERAEKSLPTNNTEIIGNIIDLIIDRKKSGKLTEEEKKNLKIQVGEKAWKAAQSETMVLQKVDIWHHT